MFEIKLTKETAIANVLRQMMGISKENMDTKMEYLLKVLNEYESDGLDLREHVKAFGVKEITDKKSLAKHINIIIKDCKHSANLISIEFDFAEKQKVLHTLTNIAVIADHILKLPETILLNYLADKWLEKGSIHTIVNNLKGAGLSTNTEVDKYLEVKKEQDAYRKHNEGHLTPKKLKATLKALYKKDFIDIADNDADENAIVCLLLKMIFLDVLESKKNKEEDSDKLAFKKEIDEQMQYLAGWIRDDYKTLGIELGTAMIELGINLNIKDGKFYMNYDFIGFCNKFNETDKGSLNLHEKVEEAIEHISKNFDDYSKNVLVHHLKSIAVGTEKTLKLPQTKLLKLLMDRWDLSSEFHSTIESLWEWEVKADSEAEIYLKNLEKKEDPVSLKDDGGDIEETVEQFWTEADSLLNTAKSPSSEIYNLILERFDWSKLSKYDTQFNLKQEPGDKNLATQQKEKIINNLWNPLFKKATTFDEYSYLLNWVIPCDKRYPFCSDYKLTNTLYDVLAQVVDENASSFCIISVLRPAEFYDVLEKKPDVFYTLAEYFVKNADAEELAGYLDPDDEYFVVIKNIVSYNIHSPFLNKVKTAFEESEWKEMLDLLEIDAEDIEDSIKNLKKKDDPVSLKDESDKTPKTEKQISTADKGVNGASETDDKKKTEEESAEKKVPIWKLIQQTIESMDGKAEKKEIINHLLGEHSHLKKNTLQCQVTICTVNNPTRINWAQNKKPRTERNQYDFLYQTDKKTVVMYDPKVHGKWGIVEDKVGKMMVTKLSN